MSTRALTADEVTGAELGRERAAEPEARAEIAKLFVMRVADTWLAVEAAGVDGVLADAGCSAVPGVPAHILGVITRGDRVLALLDVARFCGLPKSRTPPIGFVRTVIFTAGQMSVGVRVDTAVGVVEVPWRAVRPTSVLQGERLLPYLVGECETPWGLCGVLDVAHLLEDARVRE